MINHSRTLKNSERRNGYETIQVALSTAMALASLMAGVVKAQSPENYLDVFICKVKPEKRATLSSQNRLNNRRVGANYRSSSMT